MQEKWITFAYGEQPWRLLSEEAYYVFGPEGTVGEIEPVEFAKRKRVEAWKALEGLSKDDLKTFSIACNKAFR